MPDHTVYEVAPRAGGRWGVTVVGGAFAILVAIIYGVIQLFS